MKYNIFWLIVAIYRCVCYNYVVYPSKLDIFDRKERPA